MQVQILSPGHSKLEKMIMKALKTLKDTERDWKWFIEYRIFNLYYWKRIWYSQIKTRILPKNRWATKSIPRTFSDVDYIFEEVLFNGLIFFWEKDNGESSMRYQWDRELDEYDSSEHITERKEIYEKILAAYNWAKIRKSEYDSLMDYNKEQKLNLKDDEHLSVIIKYRSHLWT